MTRIWHVGRNFVTIHKIIQDILDEIFPTEERWTHELVVRNSKIGELINSSLYKHLDGEWFIRNQQDKYQHSITPKQNIKDGSIYSVRNHMEYLLNERKLTIGEYTQIQAMLRSDDVEMLKLAIRILFAKKIEEIKL